MSVLELVGEGKIVAVGDHHESPCSGSLNSQYSPSIRFSSFSFGSSGNWMALGLKYMFRTLNCSSILPRQDKIVRLLFIECVNFSRLALFFRRGSGH